MFSKQEKYSQTITMLNHLLSHLSQDWQMGVGLQQTIFLQVVIS
jgi:hypothetical protein